MGMVPFWSWYLDRLNKLSFPHPMEAPYIYIWNLTLIGPAVSEDKLFKECGRQTDRWHTTEAYLSLKLTSEPLKMITIAQLTHFCVAATAKGDLFPIGKLILWGIYEISENPKIWTHEKFR